MASKKDELQSRELRVITDRASTNRPGAGWKMRVVQYYKQGKSLAVKLEVGEYWKGDDGITRFKSKGLGDRDFDELEKIDGGKTVYSIVRALIKSPPPLPVEEPKTDPLDQPASEVPFS